MIVQTTAAISEGLHIRGDAVGAGAEAAMEAWAAVSSPNVSSEPPPTLRSFTVRIQFSTSSACDDGESNATHPPFPGRRSNGSGRMFPEPVGKSMPGEGKHRPLRERLGPLC